MDRLTSEQRHKCMASIRSKDTKPEIIVRKYLFSRGYRFRINHKILPGKPDIVLRKYRTVIFVNGCFWHGHKGCKFYTLPKTNVEFWKQKIKRNKLRDISVRYKLVKMGWHYLTIWECQLKPSVREETLRSLDYTLNKSYINDLSIREYHIHDNNQLIVAEDCYSYGE